MQSDNARPGGDLVSRFVACLAEYAIVKIVDDLKQEATDGPTQQG